MTIVPVETEAQLEHVRALLRDLHAWTYERYVEPGLEELFEELYSKPLREEADRLTVEEDAPGPRFLLAVVDGRPAGCVAMQSIGSATCELKRMYVAPAFRRLGLGRALVAALLAAAEGAGHARVRLETGSRHREAIALYRKAGFRPVGSSDTGLVSMEARLAS